MSGRESFFSNLQNTQKPSGNNIVVLWSWESFASNFLAELFCVNCVHQGSLFGSEPCLHFEKKKQNKLECLGALCCVLPHPQLSEKKKMGEIKRALKIARNIQKCKNKSCLKLPELPRNHISTGMDRQTDRQTTG